MWSHYTTQRSSVFDSTLDAVSRHCEKKLRCQIQSCLDVIKHIYIYIFVKRSKAGLQFKFKLCVCARVLVYVLIFCTYICIYFIYTLYILSIEYGQVWFIGDAHGDSNQVCIFLPYRLLQFQLATMRSFPLQ